MYILELTKQEKERLLECFQFEKLILSQGKRVFAKKLGKQYLTSYLESNQEFIRKIKDLKEI